MANRVLVAASLFAGAACIGRPASAQDEVPGFEDRELEALASPELQTFG